MPRSICLDVDALNELALLGDIQPVLFPLDTSPPFGGAEVYQHQMPAVSIPI